MSDEEASAASHNGLPASEHIPSSALIPAPALDASDSNHDITRSYFLDPSSVRNYAALTEQLLEDHQRPVKTKVHLDVNLSVDLDLSPEVHGDLHLSMMCVTIRRKPWDEDVLASDGRRIAGTVLRISDGGGRLVHRQVVGFESFGEWWWVVRIQLRELVKRKASASWEGVKGSLRELGIGKILMISAFPVALLAVIYWQLYIH